MAQRIGLAVGSIMVRFLRKQLRLPGARAYSPGQMGEFRRGACTAAARGIIGVGVMAKKRGPFQTVPVMARAIADRLE